MREICTFAKSSIDKSNMIKLIIFDFDGTLGDTRRNIVLTLQQTMCALGLTVQDEAVCTATIGLTLEDGFRKMYPELDESAIESCVITYRHLFDENRKYLVPQLFPGVADTLKDLKERGLTMAVASSRSSKSLNEFLSEMGIAPCMSLVIGADNVTKAKPDPESVLKVLSAFDISADEALVVGDMGVDIQMGKAAGAKTCGVTWGNGSRQDLLDAGADNVIDSMPELFEKAIYCRKASSRALIP